MSNGRNKKRDWEVRENPYNWVPDEEGGPFRFDTGNSQGNEPLYRDSRFFAVTRGEQEGPYASDRQGRQFRYVERATRPEDSKFKDKDGTKYRQSWVLAGTSPVNIRHQGDDSFSDGGTHVWERQITPIKKAKPKAEQAVQTAQSWQYQNPAPPASTQPVASAVPSTDTTGRTVNPSPGGSGFTPAMSYAQALSGSTTERNSLYDMIAQRGRERTQEFRAIGRDYAQQAMQATNEISQAAWNAVQGFTPKMVATMSREGDYLHPFRTNVKGGKSLYQLIDRMMEV